jgi:hypothetical protein
MVSFQFIVGIVLAGVGFALAAQEPEAVVLKGVDVRPLYRCYWPSFLIFFVATLGLSVSSTFKWRNAPFVLLTAYSALSIITTLTCFAVGIFVTLLASRMTDLDLNNCITLSTSQRSLYLRYGPVCFCSPDLQRLSTGETNTSIDDVQDFFAFSSDCADALDSIPPLLISSACLLMIAGVHGLLATILGCYSFAFSERPAEH